VGQARAAAGDLLRHHLVRLRRLAASGEVREIFNVVRDARDAALPSSASATRRASRFTVGGRRRLSRGGEKAGYGDFFVHRTGHSIGEEVHGNGVNIDNLETRTNDSWFLESASPSSGDLPGRGDGGPLGDQRVHHSAGKVEVGGRAAADLVLIDVHDGPTPAAEGEVELLACRAASTPNRSWLHCEPTKSLPCRREALGSVYGLTLDGLGEVAIVVPRERAEEARALLAAADAHQLEIGEDSWSPQSAASYRGRTGA